MDTLNNLSFKTALHMEDDCDFYSAFCEKYPNWNDYIDGNPYELDSTDPAFIIATIAHEKYKLCWMMKNQATLQQIISDLESIQTYSIMHGKKVSISEVFYKWEEEYGFYNCEIWKPLNEFIKNEYLNVKYIRSLLSEEEFKWYIRVMSFTDARNTILEVKRKIEEVSMAQNVGRSKRVVLVRRNRVPAQRYLF